MKRRSETPPDPAVVRELTTIDAALAGAPVEPELADLERFVLSLRDERPRTRAGFARELDARAEAGFPSKPRFAVPWRSRRWLLPALGAAASLLLAAIVALPLIGGGDHGAGAGKPSTSPVAAPLESAGRSAAASPSTGTNDIQLAPIPPAGADVLSAQRVRKVERQAYLTLSAPSDRVESVANSVIALTTEAGGVVVSSSISSGDNAAGASFVLRIPTGRLQATLARFSKLAHVRSLNQTGLDITGTFVSAQHRLGNALAERQALLRALAKATTLNEVESIRARLRITTAEIGRARANVRRLRERTDFSVVNLAIEARHATGHGGGWTPGDALHDALRVLAVALGVMLVALAIVLPVAALGLLGALATRRARRLRREQALDAI